MLREKELQEQEVKKMMARQAGAKDPNQQDGGGSKNNNLLKAFNKEPDDRQENIEIGNILNGLEKSRPPVPTNQAGGENLTPPGRQPAPAPTQPMKTPPAAVKPNREPTPTDNGDEEEDAYNGTEQEEGQGEGEGEAEGEGEGEGEGEDEGDGEQEGMNSDEDAELNAPATLISAIKPSQPIQPAKASGRPA